MGLSYTEFRYSAGAVNASSYRACGVIGVSAKVSNVGARDSDEVVQAYFHPLKVAVAQHPIKSMFGFQRLRDVAAGGTTLATFAVSPTSFLLATQSGDMVQEPGDYLLTFENGAGSVLSTKIPLTGSRMVVDAFPQP